MMSRFRTLWLLGKRTVQEYGADNCSQLAAAISYYVLFSLVPLVIVLVSVFGFIVRDKDVERELVDRIVAAAPLEQQDGENLVADTLHGVSRASGALTVVGLIGMGWSASAMFGAIRRALNIAWDIDTSRPLVQQKLLDLAMVAGLGLLLAASIASTTALRLLRELSDDALGPLSTNTGFFWSVLPFFLPAVLSFTVFLLLYRFVPNAPAKLGEVWVGALFATALFELLKNGYAIYVANFNNYDLVYGSLGAVMLFLLWTYLSANILLLGAELSSEYGRLRRGEYAEAASQPGRPLRDEVIGFVRRLFVHDRDEREQRERDAKARG